MIRYSNNGFCNDGNCVFTISINLPVSSSKATKSATAPLVVVLANCVETFAPFTNCKGFTGAVKYQPDKN